jgi:uncharacterized protein (DUF58 family)
MPNLQPRVRSNSSSVFSIAALGLLAVIAGALNSHWLVMAFGIPFLVGPLFLYVLLRHSIRRLSVERDTLDAVFENEAVVVTLRLRNRSRLPVFFPTVTDDFKPEYHAHRTCVFADRILPGEVVEGRYHGRCLLPRGVYPLGPGVLSISDPFGWIQIQKRLPSKNLIKVYPAIRDFGLQNRASGPVAAIRDVLSRAAQGESQDFLSAREYRIGDPLRRIHWGLSAHRGFPVVREYTRNSLGNLTVFLDLHRQSLLGIGRGSSLEHAIRICVAFCNHALRCGHETQVVAHGQEPIFVAPGRGLDHLRQILDTMVTLRPDGDVTLPELLRQHRSRLRRGDTIVYPVNPQLQESREFTAEVRALGAMGLRQVALVLDEQTFRSLNYEDHSGVDRTSKLLTVMPTLGVECYMVSCGANLELVFR